MQKFKNFLIKRWIFLLIALVIIIIGGIIVACEYHIKSEARISDNKTQTNKDTTLEVGNNKNQEMAADNSILDNKDAIPNITSPTNTSSSVSGKKCPGLDGRLGITVYPDHDCAYTLKALGELSEAVIIVENPNIKTDDGQFYKINNSPGTSFVSIEDALKIIKSDKSYENILSCVYVRDSNSNIIPSCAQKEEVITFNYINTFLSNYAKVYNTASPAIHPTFFGPFSKEVPTVPEQVRDALREVVSSRDLQLKNFDIVTYLYISYASANNQNAFISNADSGTHESFVSLSLFQFPYLGEGAFIHENLHLLGASDKYNSDNCKFINNENILISDVMCSPYFSKNPTKSEPGIGNITAHEIGWGNN